MLKPQIVTYWFINSAKINVIWAEIIVKVISADSLFFICHKIFENKIHINHQNKIHQINIDKNEVIHSKKTAQWITHHSKIIHKTTKNKAKAVQSLNKLSHSKIKVSLFGAQTDLKIDKTATGSVAEIKTQKSKQTKNGISNQTNGNKKYNQAQINQAENISQKIAKNHIDFQLLRSCLWFIL